MRETARDFMRDEAGMGTVEIILIIVVLIGLVIIFKKQLNDLVKILFRNYLLLFCLLLFVLKTLYLREK